MGAHIKTQNKPSALPSHHCHHDAFPGADHPAQMSGHPCGLYGSDELLTSIEASFADLPDLDIPDVPRCLLENLSGYATALDLGPLEQADHPHDSAVSKGQQPMAKMPYFSDASPLVGHGKGTAADVNRDALLHPLCVTNMPGSVTLIRDDSTSTAFEAFLMGPTQPMGEIYTFEESACDCADTWVMTPAADSPVHYRKELPPASAGHAWTSPPQESMNCSPIVSAFLGSFFDPACLGVDHLSMLAQLAPADRHTARRLMRNLLGNLQELVPAALPPRDDRATCQMVVKSVSGSWKI